MTHWIAGADTIKWEALAVWTVLNFCGRESRQENQEINMIFCIIILCTITIQSQHIDIFYILEWHNLHTFERLILRPLQHSRGKMAITSKLNESSRPSQMSRHVIGPVRPKVSNNRCWEVKKVQQIFINLANASGNPDHNSTSEKWRQVAQRILQRGFNPLLIR